MTPFLEEACRLLRLANRDLETYRILAALIRMAPG